MSDDLDIDALLDSGALDSDEDRRERRVAMRRVADAAFRADISYSIDMAKAGWAAVEKEARRAEASRRARSGAL